MESSSLRYAFQMVVCTFAIFLLSPASGSMHMMSMRSHPNALADNFPSDVFPEDNAISVEPTDEGSFQINSPDMISSDQIHIPKGILDQIFKTMEQSMDAVDAQDGHQDSSDENPLLISSDTHSEDMDMHSPTIIAHSTGNMLPPPNPTPAPPTVDDDDDVHSTDKPKLKHTTTHTQVHIQMSVPGKSGDVKGSDNMDDMNSPMDCGPSDALMKPLDDHANHLWTSTLPILVKNHKASLFSKPDFDDMSKVLPDLPSFMDTLNKIHKPGHVTIMMMNPKHLPVDKEVVKNSNICCELRQHLLNKHGKKDIYSDDEQSSSYPTADDEIPAELQSFLSSLLHHSADDDLPMPASFDDNHHDSNDIDSPWNDNEKSLVSRIFDNLHLFDQPGHLSAVSFHPRHIVQKKNPTLLHIRIRIHIPTQGRSDSSDLGNSLFNSGNDLHSLFPEDQDTMEPFDSQDVFHPKPKKVAMKMTITHRKGRLTVHEYPLNNFSDVPCMIPDLPSLAPKQESLKKKMTMFYLIHHNHQGAQDQSSLTPNIQTILRDIFKLPLHRDFPSDDFSFPHGDDSFRSQHEFQDDPFASQPTTDPVQEILSHIFADDSSDMPELSGESLPAPPLAEDSLQSFSPLDILNQLSSQDRHYPQDVFSDRGNFLPEDDYSSQKVKPSIHITHMRIVHTPDHPSDDDFSQFMG